MRRIRNAFYNATFVEGTREINNFNATLSHIMRIERESMEIEAEDVEEET